MDSNFNPADPLDDGTGVVTSCDNTGWTTVVIKLGNPAFSRTTTSVCSPAIISRRSKSDWDQFASPDYRNQTRARATSQRRKTSLDAFFAQLGWRFHPDWEATVGARQEFWSSRDGFAESSRASRKQPERDVSKLSPKFSLGWEPATRVRLQYSVARSYRFPVPEELFDNQIRTFGTVLGDASLEPEAGVHHNVSVQYGLGDGHIEANLFRDDVDDTIFTQFQFVARAAAAG